jgi:hypothetical protein
MRRFILRTLPQIKVAAQTRFTSQFAELSPKVLQKHKDILAIVKTAFDPKLIQDLALAYNVVKHPDAADPNFIIKIFRPTRTGKKNSARTS